MNLKAIVRPLLILAALYLCVLVSKSHPNALMAAICAVVMFGAIKYFLVHARKAKWMSKWSAVRRIRRMRQAFQVSPNTLALYAACVVFGCAGVALHHMSGGDVSTCLLILSGISLCVATIMDWSHRLRYMLEPKATQRVAWWVLGFLGTTTAFLSNVTANHIVTYVAQANPSEMAAFVRLASAAIFPFSLAVVISGSLVLVMLVQSAAVLVGGVVSSLYGNMSLLAPGTLKQRVEYVAYRLIKGHRPPQHRPWWDKLMAGYQFMLRPIGTGAIAVLVILAGQAAFQLSTYLPLPYLQRALVLTEYHSPHQCENVAKTASIAFQADGYVSVAVGDGEGYSFTTTKCHK